MSDRRVVLGLGNLLFGDEGFGIHAVQYLQEQLGEEYGVEWIDGGVLGMNLLPLVEECSHLLVLDAVDAGQPAGTLVELAGDLIPFFTTLKLSEHQLGFQEVLALARFRGHLPRQLSLIGVQPANLQTAIQLSPVVAATLPELPGRVRAILKDWL